MTCKISYKVHDVSKRWIYIQSTIRCAGLGEWYSKDSLEDQIWSFEFLVRSFGIGKCPAVFMDPMNNIFRPFKDLFVIVLVMIFLYIHYQSQSIDTIFEQCLRYFEVKKKLYAKLSKCEFCCILWPSWAILYQTLVYRLSCKRLRLWRLGLDTWPQ